MVTPLVSVVIPTFNRSHYVGAAISSALGQTLNDIEVVVVDDGSTDATTQLLESINDPRLRVIRHESNRGIPETRNTGLSAARGRYIAWLDSDDVARSNRLAEQVAFLEVHPEIAMVGACAGKLRPDGTRKSGIRVPPLTPELISAWLLFRSAFQQSSVTGRSEVLSRYRYDSAYPVCEDVDMFLRLQQHHKLANLPRILVDRRLHPEQSVRQRQHEINARMKALAKPMLERIGIPTSEFDLDRHVLLGKASFENVDVQPNFLDWALAWLNRLNAENNRTQVYDPASLRLASAYFWVLACRAMAPRIGRAAALGFLRDAPPWGLTTPATVAWVLRALPAYVSK